MQRLIEHREDDYEVPDAPPHSNGGAAAPRLLVITESFEIGGTETHLLRLLPRLAAHGWRVATFCLSGRGQRAGQLEAAGIEVFCKAAPSPGKSIRNPIRIARAAWDLYRLARRWRPHIAHFYLPGPYLVGAPICALAGVPIGIMSRRSLSHYQQSRPALARLERHLHRRMDWVIANARALVPELLAEGVPEEKITVIYNGLDLSKTVVDRAEVRERLGLPPDAIVGVMVANLFRYKGHIDLIKALARVANELPSNWRILCAGADKGIRAELEALLDIHELRTNVWLMGERSDVPDLLAAADFGLLTSSANEGFSNAILESMAAGLPMIVTAMGGNSEAVLDQVTGFVVPPGNSQAIGEAVVRLMRDFDLRRDLGAAGRRRVEQHFSLDRCVVAHVRLYEELMVKAGFLTP